MPARPQAQEQGQGQQGGLPALQPRIQALEQAVAALNAALNALSAQVGTLSADAQARFARVSAQLTAFQQLLDQYNQGLITAEGKITTLEGKVADLEAELADLGGGLTSYDQLTGLPCTTGVNGAGTIHLIGLLKSPVCAAGISANDRFFDLGPVVLDTQTNLMREKKDQVGGLHDVANRYN
jgi:hypothetical protein